MNHKEALGPMELSTYPHELFFSYVVIYPLAIYPGLSSSTPLSREGKPLFMLFINKGFWNGREWGISSGQSEIRVSFQEEAAFETRRMGRQGRLWMAGDGNMMEGGISSRNNKEREAAMSGLCTGTWRDRGEQGMRRWE